MKGPRRLFQLLKLQYCFQSTVFSQSFLLENNEFGVQFVNIFDIFESPLHLKKDILHLKGCWHLFKIKVK